MKLPKYLTTVTHRSKTIALILFVLLPIFGFILGMKYQSALDSSMAKNSSVVHEKRHQNQPEKLLKTYTNTNLGITFQYPFAWQISINDESIEVCPTSYSSRSCFTIGSTDKPPLTYALEQERKRIDCQKLKLSDNDLLPRKSDTPLQVGINDDIKGELYYGCTDPSGYIFLFGPKKTIVIFEAYNDWADINSVGAILSTFQFIDQTYQNTQNWKKYESEQFGFSFRYPQPLVFKNITGEGGDLAKVPFKASFSNEENVPVIFVTVEKRSCNSQKEEIVLDGKKAVRFVTEGYMQGSLFSHDNVEFLLEPKLCFHIRKYAVMKGGTGDDSKDKKPLDELKQMNKDMYDLLLSTIQFKN